MKPSEVKIGDLISTGYGYARVMKFFAPALIGCIIVTPTGRDGTKQGQWIYLRGYALDQAKVISLAE